MLIFKDMFKLLFFKLLLITLILGSCSSPVDKIVRNGDFVISDTLQFLKDRTWIENDTVNLRYSVMLIENGNAVYQNVDYYNVFLVSDTLQFKFSKADGSFRDSKCQILSINNDSLVVKEIINPYPFDETLEKLIFFNDSFYDRGIKLEEIQLGYKHYVAGDHRVKLSSSRILDYIKNDRGDSLVSSYNSKQSFFDSIQEMTRRIDFKSLKQNYSFGMHMPEIELLFKFKNGHEYYIHTCVLNYRLDAIVQKLLDMVKSKTNRVKKEVKFDLKSDYTITPIPQEPPPEDY